MDVTVAMFMEKVRHPKDFNAAFIAANETTVKRCFVYFAARVAQPEGIEHRFDRSGQRHRVSEFFACRSYGHQPIILGWRAGMKSFPNRPSLQETAPREK